MNKFGLLDEIESDFTPNPTSIGDRIAAFSPTRPREKLDMTAVDAAAAPHGFTSREATVSIEVQPATRRRRALPSEPTRHLAIRLNASAYSRFVAYADRYKLTYHDALVRLLEGGGG